MEVFTTEAVFEQSGDISLMARVKVKGGTWGVQADFDSVILKVFLVRDPGSPVNGANGEDIDPSSVFFNALRTTDPVSSETIWTKDSAGFNFLYRTTADQLPTGGDKYRFEFKCSKSGNEDLWIPFEIPTLGLYSV